jgi:hypothetical protein
VVAFSRSADARREPWPNTIVASWQAARARFFTRFWPGWKGAVCVISEKRVRASANGRTLSIDLGRWDFSRYCLCPSGAFDFRCTFGVSAQSLQAIANALSAIRASEPDVIITGNFDGTGFGARLKGGSAMSGDPQFHGWQRWRQRSAPEFLAAGNLAALGSRRVSAAKRALLFKRVASKGKNIMPGAAA